MQFNNVQVTTKVPVNTWTKECFKIVKEYIADLEFPDLEKEVLYKGHNLGGLFKAMAVQISSALSSHQNPCVAIVYHRDLDGGTSALIAAEFIRCIYAGLVNSNGDIMLEMISINYNDHLTKRSKRILNNADLVISVDYSCSNSEHMRTIFGLRENINKKVIYIDHHQSSLKSATDNDSFKEFLNEPNIEYIIAEKDNCSAALLTYIMCMGIMQAACSCSENVLDMLQDDETDVSIAVARSVPEYIMYVSLYDTFSKLASREFSMGVSSVPHMPYEWYDETSSDQDIFLHGINSGYYEKMLRFFNITVSTDYFKQGLSYSSLFEVPSKQLTDSHKTITKNDISEYPSIESILANGSIIKDYDVRTHNMCRRKNEFDVVLSFDDGSGEAKQYNVAVINGFGNSFAFEESYYNHDGVIIYAMSKNLDYVYSFFADKHYDNPNRLPCNKIAEMFGGGGHPTAAGCTLSGNIFDTRYGFLSVVSEGEYHLDLTTSNVLSDFLNEYVYRQ